MQSHHGSGVVAALVMAKTEQIEDYTLQMLRATAASIVPWSGDEILHHYHIAAKQQKTIPTFIFSMFLIFAITTAIYLHHQYGLVVSVYIISALDSTETLNSATKWQRAE